MLEIKIRKLTICKEVKIKNSETEINLGLLDEEECKTLALTFEEAVDSLME